MKTTVHLEADAVYTGWEIICFGRAASGQKFNSELLTQHTQILAEGQHLWSERARVAGDDALFASPIGMSGHGVCATLLAAGREISSEAVGACREVAAGEGAIAGVTRLPRLLIARWLGDAGEDARRYLSALWRILRPELKNCVAVEPRIWST